MERRRKRRRVQERTEERENRRSETKRKAIPAWPVNKTSVLAQLLYMLMETGGGMMHGIIKRHKWTLTSWTSSQNQHW